MQSAGNLHCGRTEGPGLNALRRYPVLRELHGRFSAIRYFWVGPMGATKQVGRFSPLLFPRFPKMGETIRHADGMRWQTYQASGGDTAYLEFSPPGAQAA